jgi:hypothetical protein
MKPFFVFCLLLIWSLPAAAQQVISARAGMVKNVRGEVFYRCHLNDKEALSLQKGLMLHNGDTVLTTESGDAAFSLNPDSYLVLSANSFVRIRETDLKAMHFDVERGEILVISRSLKKGVSLVIHTPPAILTVYKRGNYRIFVAENGNTEANVGRGELRYLDGQGNLIRVKKGKQMNFVKREKMKIP